MAFPHDEIIDFPLHDFFIEQNSFIYLILLLNPISTVSVSVNVFISIITGINSSNVSLANGYDLIC